MTNTIQILNPAYINDVVRPYIAAQKASKFGISENYNTGYIFDDLTEDDLFNFGEIYGNGNENENETEMNYENETENENENETKPNMRVYDMNPDQLYKHMINKFGSRFANEYTAEKYVNSNGVPAVKYIKSSKNSSVNVNEN